MTEHISIHDTEASVRPTRNALPHVIALVCDASRSTRGTWNVVEALELLIDAGQFRLAHELAATVAKLVATDGRGRLFRMYETLCDLFMKGNVADALETLEALHAGILAGGHSVSDCVRSGVLVARAILAGVLAGSLDERLVASAIALLSGEFDRAATHDMTDLACQVGLELAKARIHGPTPDTVSARALLTILLKLSSNPDVRPDVRFDILRFLYHTTPAGAETSLASFEAVDAQQLREEGARIGGVASALAELSIARRAATCDEDTERALVSARDIFMKYAYLAGAFEASHKRGTSALALQHFAKADRCFIEGLSASSEGGFLYGECMSLLGQFQCAFSSGAKDQAAVVVEQLGIMSRSELGLGTVGLSVVAAHQMLGNYPAGAELSKRCARFFHARGALALESQARFSEGACFAGQNRWDDARRAWERCCRIDEQRRAPVAACDKMAAIAQAIAMAEFMTSGSLGPVALAKVEKLLTTAERQLDHSVGGAEVARVKGKVLQTRAQLCVIAQHPVEALKTLGRAREVYESVDAHRDVAIVDGLSGLALLEASKTRGPAMLDESAAALRRSLDYFSGHEHLPVRWKLKYYLCIATYMSAQSKSSEDERTHLRTVATGWLTGAMDDSERMKSGEGLEGVVVMDSDFSPGLSPEALEPLKKALGLPQKQKLKDQTTVEVRGKSKRLSKNLH